MIGSINLTGWWRIKFDERNHGAEWGWANQIPDHCQEINVPSCWNEMFPERYFMKVLHGTSKNFE